MFKYSAFTESTSEMREWLKGLGWREKYFQENANIVLCAANTGMFSSFIEEEHGWFKDNCPECIDCYSNPSLFKAVTAMRDDSDYMQYFTDGEEWVLCDREDWEDMHSTLCCGGNYKNGELDKFRKATLEELINHFKSKQEDEE